MKRATALILVIGFCAACNLDSLSSDYCPLAPNGHCSSQGSQITYVREQVMIDRGGVLVPGTLKTRGGATVNQRPAVQWTNQDTVSHHLVFDVAGHDTGEIAPTAIAELSFDSNGTFAYHCVIHPRMAGTVVVP